MDRLRVGLIGLGGRSGGHTEAVDAIEQLEMATAADLDESRHERFRQSYGSVPVYGQGTDMLDRERPDIAILCTMEYPRYELAMAAIEAGVRAIVLEKPMARTLDQAREMVSRARERGVTMVVSHQMRFADEFVRAREAIEAGRIGTPYYARVSSFGQLMEQGPHMVDMLLYLLGDPEVEWVMGQVADIEEGRDTVHPAPAFTLGYIAFANGVRAVVECGRVFQRAVGLEDVTWLQKRAQVIGTEGMTDSVVAHHCRFLGAEGGWQTLFEGSSGWDNATIGLYAELAGVLGGEGQHRNDAALALKGFEIVQGIFQSAVCRDRVSLPLPGGAAPLEEIMPPA